MTKPDRISAAMFRMLSRMVVTGSWFDGRAIGRGERPWAYGTMHALQKRGMVDERERITGCGRIWLAAISARYRRAQ